MTAEKPASEWCAYIKYLMARQGLSQRDVAAAIGYSQPGVRGFIIGDTLPPLDKIPQLVKALHLDDEEKRKFSELAQEASLPPWVMAELRTLRGLVKSTIQRQTDLELKLERVLTRYGGKEPVQFPLG